MKIVDEKIKPICPFCEKKLDKIIKVDQGGYEGNRVFCCPNCHKILGMGKGA